MAREFKDSGIEWIGQIPKEWEVARLKDIKANKPYAIVDGPFGSAISTNDYKDEGVPLVRIVNLVGKYLDNTSTMYISPELANTVSRSSFGLNDIIFAKTGATIGKCSINNSIEYGILSSSCVKISIADDMDNRYYYYLFSTDQFNQALRLACSGSTRDTINLTPFNTLPSVIPSLDEQQKIADYLDKVCGEVDEMVALQETMIEELKAYKQSVITEAVTKGLNPKVPMRNSGIDWIGEIPEHWEIRRMKYLSNVVRGGSPRPAGDTRYYEGNIPFMKVADITKDDNIYVDSCEYSIKEAGLPHTRLINPGTLLLSNSGATLGIPKINTFTTTFNDGIAAFLNLDERIDIFFAYYSLKARTKYFLESASLGIGQPNLNTDIIGNTRLLIPPLDEQRNIASYLDTKCLEIDSLIALKQAKIEELKEYKKSVIYEYVTGKKEVC